MTIGSVAEIKGWVNVKLKQSDRQIGTLINDITKGLPDPEPEQQLWFSAEIGTVATTLLSPLSYAMKAFYVAKHDELRPNNPFGTRSKRFNFENYRTEQAYLADKNRPLQDLAWPKIIVALEQSQYQDVFKAFYNQLQFVNEVQTRLNDISNTDKHEGVELVSVNAINPQPPATNTVRVLSVEDDVTTYEVESKFTQGLVIPPSSTMTVQSKDLANLVAVRGTLGERTIDEYGIFISPFTRTKHGFPPYSMYVAPMYLFQSQVGYHIPMMTVDGNTFNPLEIIDKSRKQVEKATNDIITTLEQYP